MTIVIDVAHMATNKTTISTNLKTLLIIIGIILAAVLTWNSSMFLSGNAQVLPTSPIALETTGTIEVPKLETNPVNKILKVSRFLYSNLPTLEK